MGAGQCLIQFNLHLGNLKLIMLASPDVITCANAGSLWISIIEQLDNINDKS